MSRHRRGNAITNFGVIIGGLAFTALVVDLGWNWAHVERVQYLNDAAATAAASHLNGTAEGVEEGQYAALEVMRVNDYFGRSALGSLYSGHDNLVYGTYEDPGPRSQHGGTSTEWFVPVSSPASASSSQLQRINAVQVMSADSAVPPLLSGMLFGRTTLAAASTSIAVSGRSPASEVGCYLPVGVPICHFNETDLETLKDVQLSFHTSAPVRVGWGRVGGNPNANFQRAQLADSCSGGLAGIGDSMQLTQGVMQAVLMEVETLLASSSTSWAPEMGPLPAPMAGSTHPSYGRTLEAPILVFDGGDAYCNGTGSWSGSVSHPVAGIAWGVIYDVKSSGPRADRDIAIRFDFGRWHDMGTAGGGPDFGVFHSGITQLVR